MLRASAYTPCTCIIACSAESPPGEEQLQDSPSPSSEIQALLILHKFFARLFSFENRPREGIDQPRFSLYREESLDASSTIRTTRGLVGIILFPFPARKRYIRAREEDTRKRCRFSAALTIHAHHAHCSRNRDTTLARACVRAAHLFQPLSQVRGLCRVDTQRNAPSITARDAPHTLTRRDATGRDSLLHRACSLADASL